jgi:phospholipase/carboxylesterase
MNPLSTFLPCIEIETGDNPQYSVIWMHGLGADGSDFEPVVPELGLPDSPAVRFVFPNAPEIAVTCNGGFVMPAWYDIISLDGTSRTVDEAGIVGTRMEIRRLIARENQRGIPCQRIFLAGFSQGGAIAYVTALTHPEALAGVIALSTYIPVSDLLTREATRINESIPIFVAHGSEDDVVSLELGVRACELLTKLGHQYRWQTYPMPHSICLEEIQDLGQWMRGILAAN